jgi:hypothetical protein
MKTINTLQGITALRLTDEAQPPRGIVIQNLLSQIQARYRFAGRPVLAGLQPQIPNIQAQPMQFQSGQFQSADGIVPINALIYSNEALLIVCQRTELSDNAMKDLTENILNRAAGFRIGESSYRPYHISNVVVQFEFSLEEKIEKLRRIIEIITGAVSKHKHLPGPISTTRLAFTAQAWNVGMVPLSADSADQQDFMIERRVGQPFEDNWYFSAAPLTTPEHLATLEAIEAAVR